MYKYRNLSKLTFNFVNVFILGYITLLFFFDMEGVLWLQVVSFNLNGYDLVLGCDNLSFIFIMLSVLLVEICVLIIWNMKYRLKFMLILLCGVLIVSVCLFLFLDLLFFYIFFEVLLIPLFFFIGIWGTKSRKVLASLKLFLYTVLGSFFMFLGLLLLYSQCGSFNMYTLILYKMSFPREFIFFFFLMFGFAIKMPMFPFHGWLPEAHVEATTAGSVILAGLILKMASYGLCRFLLPLCVTSIYYTAPLLNLFILIGLFHGLFLSCRQCDIKKAIAYMSIAHMNFSLFGLFSFDKLGYQGAIYLLIGHGLVSSALFFLVGILYDRLKTRVIFYYGGLVQIMPIWVFFFFLFILANVGFPGSINFLGEFLIFYVSLNKSVFLAFLLICSMVFSLGSTLWLYNRLVFGEVRLFKLTKAHRKHLLIGSFVSLDIKFREFCILFILLVPVVYLGIYPCFGTFFLII